MNSVADNAVLAALLSAVARQDKQAFEELYNATVDKLFGLALRITQADDLAEDVISDVYLQIWQEAGKYTPERGNVLAWLSILCRSRALDRLRKHLRFSGKEELLNDETQRNDITETDWISGFERDSRLYDALLSLDAESRQLLAMAYFRDYSHQQLAQITGKPLGTIKTKIRRALNYLKQTLTTFSANPGEIE
ncbi:MAG: RNA polymerase sigma factor [Gammaproteobacteria bacterium]